MKIKVDYSDATERVVWLSKNVGPRQYWFHNQAGGSGWRYIVSENSIEIDDEQLATLFILKFGGRNE